VASIPILADAFARNALPVELSAPVSVSLEETGQVSEDGSGFKVEGTGAVNPGSILSGTMVPTHANFIVILGRRSLRSVSRAIAAGHPIRCAFGPESFLEITLPDTLGGGDQRLTLTGGFHLLPVMTLPRTLRAARRRR
jgi:hypothetical protein